MTKPKTKAKKSDLCPCGKKLIKKIKASPEISKESANVEKLLKKYETFRDACTKEALELIKKAAEASNTDVINVFVEKDLESRVAELHFLKAQFIRANVAFSKKLKEKFGSSGSHGHMSDDDKYLGIFKN